MSTSVFKLFKNLVASHEIDFVVLHNVLNNIYHKNTDLKWIHVESDYRPVYLFFNFLLKNSQKIINLRKLEEVEKLLAIKKLILVKLK